MILIVDPDPRSRAEIASRFKTEEVVEVSSSAEAGAALANGETEVALLGPGLGYDDALALAGALAPEHPGTGFVLVADLPGMEEVQGAFRAGVRDILPRAFTPEQGLASLERVRQLTRQVRERGPSGPSDHGQHRVITVFSSKGGVGKSFISTNLALLLRQAAGKPVVLVDLDLQFGDLAIMLQLFPARTIAEAASVAPNLDEDALEGYLAEHRGGVKLLAAPFEPGLAETVAPDSVAHILRLLRRAFPYVIVDTPAALNEHVIAAIDEADRTILVGSMDVPSIKNMKLALQTLNLLGVPRDQLHLVLNRADSEVGLRLGEVEKTLGTKVEVSIPSGREVPLSINRGSPLVFESPGSPVLASIKRLAAMVTGSTEPVPVASGKEGGWLRRRSR